MGLFLLKRFATLVVTLVVASFVIFAVLELLPGNVAQLMLGETATLESIAALEQKLGLDRPAPARYAQWIGGLLTGQTALSHAYDVPTAELIGERLQVTLPLALMAMTLTVLAAIPLGLYAAARHNRVGDVAVMAASQVGIAVPSFWLAILLVLLFSVQLGWFDAGGFAGWQAPADASADGAADLENGTAVVEGGSGPRWTAAALWAGLQSLLLPAVALAAAQASVLTRWTRSSVLEVLREDFVRTARAKGLSERAVLWRHVLRNALIPVLTIMGLQVGFLISGAVVVENVFVLPGLGRLVFQAVNNRDLVVVRDVVLLLVMAVVVVNFVVDVLYAVVDPRFKLAHA
jgi:peptide/nickel transport system permease protein